MKLAIFPHNMNFFKEIYKELNMKHEVRLYRETFINLPIGKGRIREIIKKRKMLSLMSWADVSFFEWSETLLIDATKLRKKQSKIVTRLHSGELTSTADYIDWTKVDQVIFISKIMQKRFLDRFPNYPKVKTCVINNAINTEKFNIPDYKTLNNTLGVLSGLVPVKRLYDLILTFSDIKKEKPELKLIIGGGAQHWEKRYPIALMELRDKLNLKDSVIFEGKIENAQEWFNKIDIFINHSYWEGFSVSLLESMASGCYPLVHFWNGADEIIPPENIYIQNHELKQKIYEYYSWDENRRITESARYRKLIVDRFGDKKHLNELIRIIEKV